MNLDQAIYDTIRYYALFDMPVTAVQIWRTLIVASHNGKNLGQLRYADICHVLRQSPYLAARVQSQWGYFFLADQQGSVERRLLRYTIAQRKWRLLQDAARFLALVPFVRALFGSGSLALNNTRPESDLDVFVVARRGRIWTARLGLLIVSQLLGRRRKYWDQRAPDKICLNHYVTNQNMLMAPPVRNLFTAVAYTRLQPVFGHALLPDFQHANAVWMEKLVVSPAAPRLRGRREIAPGPVGAVMKSQFEKLLLEPIGDWLENQARRLQLKAIANHTAPAQKGRIVATDEELAFHPDTRVPALLAKFGKL